LGFGGASVRVWGVSREGEVGNITLRAGAGDTVDLAGRRTQERRGQASSEVWLQRRPHNLGAVHGHT